MNLGTLSQSSAIALFAAIFALTGAVGCAPMSSEESYRFKTPALESQLAAYGKALQDNGLTAQEAATIVNRARTEVNSSSSLSDDAPPEVRAMAGMVTGSIKALGKTSFGDSDERKLAAMQLIARLTLESGSAQLAQLSESDTQAVIGAIAEGQVLASQYAFLLTDENKALAYQAMTDSVLNALDTADIPLAYHTVVSETVATSTVSHLDDLGLTTTTIQALIPVLVGAAVDRLADLNTNSVAQNSMIVQFVSSTLAQINGLGLTPTQISAVKTGISSESAASLQNSGLAGDLANQIIGEITTAIDELADDDADENPDEDKDSEPIGSD
jgi:hypothetical protein